MAIHMQLLPALEHLSKVLEAKAELRRAQEHVLDLEERVASAEEVM